jgi:hypothetical protein
VQLWAIASKIGSGGSGLGHTCRNCAAVASSTTLLSADSCTVTVVATRGLSAPGRGGSTRWMPAPTARMHACGGLITAEKAVMPYMPVLVGRIIDRETCGNASLAVM